MRDEFTRLVREDMDGRGFHFLGTLPQDNTDSVCLVFSDVPASEPVGMRVTIVASGLDLMRNKRPAELAAFARSRCASAVDIYRELKGDAPST